MDRPSLPSSSSDPSLDSSPLLPHHASADSLRPAPSGVRVGLSGAARFLRRASGRRLMREPSMMVREHAAEQLEERQSDWAFSKPVVILDLIWNLAFVMVTAIVLFISVDEVPNTPLRVWVCGYCLQCIVHMVCVSSEYRRRQRQFLEQRRRRSSIVQGPYGTFRSTSDFLGGDQSSQDGEAGFSTNSFPKRLESGNTMFSFVWWIIGFYWITAGGQALIQEAPRLYWLSVVFLAFDVLFVMFCVALACVIGLAVCCCLPCIIAILYAVADQEGASDEEINALAKFIFHSTGSFCKDIEENSTPSRGIMVPIVSSGAETERFLVAENAECCICLSAYEDGVELRELPCGHHFHCACIDKWLHINATCPLCKYNIIKKSNGSSEEACDIWPVDNREVMRTTAASLLEQSWLFMVDYNAHHTKMYHEIVHYPESWISSYSKGIKIGGKSHLTLGHITFSRRIIEQSANVFIIFRVGL